jgi:hypothetical protein
LASLRLATYCLPLTSKVIGGAAKPEPTFTLYNSSSVVSSKAATLPSSRAEEHKTAAGRKRPRKVRLSQVDVLLDLLRHRIDDSEVAFHAADVGCVPPFQPRSALCLARSISTFKQPVKAEM